MATFDRTAAPAARPPHRFRGGPPFAAPAAPAAPVDSDRLRGIAGLVLLAVVVFLAIALATFDPADPPAGQAFSPPVRPANACGLLGSTVAAALLAAFGHGAWWVLGLLAAFDVHLLRRRPLGDLPLRTAGAIAATLGLCTLLALLVPAWVARPVWGAGGRVGAVGRFLGEAWLAHTGAVITALAVTLGGIWLACETAFLAAWRGIMRAALAAASLLVAAVRVVGGFVFSRRAAPLADDDADTAIATAAVPGILSAARRAATDTADDDDVDADDDGPTIRVRRRTPEPQAAAADDSFAADDLDDSADDLSDDSAVAADAGDDDGDDDGIDE